MLKAIANFFLVNRALLHSDRWLREPFTRGQAWVDLFGLAQHSDGYMLIRGVRVDLKRGQLGYSQVTLGKRWKWSREKVRRYLSRLETARDIVQQNTQVTTIITIVNYSTWQGYPDETLQQTIQQTVQQKNNRKTVDNTHTNNVNKNNNENKINTYTQQQVLDAAYPVGVDHEKAVEFFNHYNAQGWVFGNGQSVSNLQSALNRWKNKQYRFDKTRKESGKRKVTAAEQLEVYENAKGGSPQFCREQYEAEMARLATK